MRFDPSKDLGEYEYYEVVKKYRVWAKSKKIALEATSGEGGKFYLRSVTVKVMKVKKWFIEGLAKELLYQVIGKR